MGWLSTPKSESVRVKRIAMRRHPRPVRIPVLGGRAQVASTIADLVNVSRTGALIRTGYELRIGSEWPFVLEFPLESVRVTGRVVRCERADVVLAGGAALRSWRALAVTFVQPSAEAERVLEELCGTALDSGDCDNDCDAG